MLGTITTIALGAGCTHPTLVCTPAPGATPAAGALRADPAHPTATTPPLVERTVWITPEIRADTRVLDDDTQSAQVTFASGAQPMLVIALSQGANTAISERGAAVGTARINPGLRLDLQIATPLQNGAVYLDGTFASSNLPNVHFQGVLATWSAPPPPLHPPAAAKE